MREGDPKSEDARQTAHRRLSSHEESGNALQSRVRLGCRIFFMVRIS